MVQPHSAHSLFAADCLVLTQLAPSCTGYSMSEHFGFTCEPPKMLKRQKSSRPAQEQGGSSYGLKRLFNVR